MRSTVNHVHILVHGCMYKLMRTVPIFIGVHVLYVLTRICLHKLLIVVIRITHNTFLISSGFTFVQLFLTGDIITRKAKKLLSNTVVVGNVLTLFEGKSLCNVHRFI